MRSTLGGVTLAMALLAAPMVAQQAKPDTIKKPAARMPAAPAPATGTVKPPAPKRAMTDSTIKPKLMKHKKKGGTKPKPVPAKP